MTLSRLSHEDQIFVNISVISTLIFHINSLERQRDCSLFIILSSPWYLPAVELLEAAPSLPAWSPTSPQRIPPLSDQRWPKRESITHLKEGRSWSPIYVPACRLGSRTARCAGGWCGDPAGWPGTAPASSACRRECPTCETHPPASVALGGEQQLKWDGDEIKNKAWK